MPTMIAPTIDWSKIPELFPCPDDVWIGPWEEIGDLCGRAWDVWGATYSALSATAHRDLFWNYYRSPLYGMSYVLSIAPTSSGKEYALDIIASLLPKDYNVRDAVSSGQALFPILADLTSKEKIKPAKPTILLINEWTKLLRLAGVQHSTLMDELDSIFHTARAWNISRSDRGGEVLGGGDRICDPPSLSIFACTTPQALLSEVSDAHVNRGFINRYLILPGPSHDWEAFPENAPPASPAAVLKGQREEFAQKIGQLWGEGISWETAFTEEAKEWFDLWLTETIGPIMRESSTSSNRKKRLHFYANHIALLSAWGRTAGTKAMGKVELADVQMAAAVTDTSRRFVDFLWEEEALPMSLHEESAARIEQAIYKRIADQPNRYDNESLRQSLRRTWPGVNRGKIREATTNLEKEGTILTDPYSGKYITEEYRQEQGGTIRARRGDFLN